MNKAFVAKRSNNQNTNLISRVEERPPSRIIMRGFQRRAKLKPLRGSVACLTYAFGVLLMMPLSLASDEDWLTVIHTSDIQSHFDESGASAKACAAGAHCFGGMPRLVKLVREERARSKNVVVVDAGGLFNTALIGNPTATELLSELVPLVGYDAMTLGQPELMGDLDSVWRYVSLVGAPFVCTSSHIPPGSNLTLPACNSSQTLIAGSIKVGIVSYLSLDVEEFKVYGIPNGTFALKPERFRNETAVLRREGAGLIIALIYTSWPSMNKNMSDIMDTLKDVDLVVAGNSGHFFFNGSAPHGEVASRPYPTTLPRDGRPPLLVVGSHPMLHYAGVLRLRVSPGGGYSDWRASNPRLLVGDKDPAAEAVMARLRPSQDALLGGLVGRSMYMLEGGAHCRRRECVLGTLVADAMLEASIQPVYKGNDILAWTRAGTVIFHGSAVRASIAPGLVREEDLRVALPLDENLVITPVLGSRLVNLLEEAVRTDLFRGLQVSGLRLGYAPDPEEENKMKAHSMTLLCIVCQMPSFKEINQRYTYRIVSTEKCVKEDLSKITGGLYYEKLNHTLRDATRTLVRKLTPLAADREDRISLTSIQQRTVTGGARARTNSDLDVKEAALVAMLLLVI